MFDFIDLHKTLLDIECAHYELNPKEASMIEKLAAARRENYSAADVRRIAILIKSAYASLGWEDEYGYKVYSGLANNPDTDIGSRKLASIGYQSLGRVSLREHIMEKNATTTSTILRTLGFLPTVAGEVGKLLAVTGLLGGGAVGGAAWAARRGLTSEDTKLRQLEAQRDTYGRLAHEVSEELKRRNLAPTPENTAAAVDYLT